MLYDPKWDKPKVTNRTRATLIAARKLIENEKNWCQHQFRKGIRHCALGAILYSDADRRDQYDAMAKLSQALNLNSDARFIVDWNDHDSRTHAEVLAAFDRAIALS